MIKFINKFYSSKKRWAGPRPRELGSDALFLALFLLSSFILIGNRKKTNQTFPVSEDFHRSSPPSIILSSIVDSRSASYSGSKIPLLFS